MNPNKPKNSQAGDEKGLQGDSQLEGGKDILLTGEREASRPSRVYKMVIVASLLLFFAVIAPAMLHSNDTEFFSALFGGGSTLPEEVVLEYASLYDSVYYIAYIAGLVMSPIADKSGKRKVFILTGSLMFVVMSMIMLTSTTIGFLLFIRLLQGVFHIFCWQTLMVLVYDYSIEGNRAKSIAISSIFMGAAMGMGTMLGGFIAEIGPFAPMWFAVCSYSVVLVLSIILVKDKKQVEQRPTLKDGLLLFKDKPHILVPGLFNFIDRFHMGFLITMVPLYLDFVFGLSEGLRGMIFGMSAIPSLFIAFPVGKKSDKDWGRFKPLIWGSVVYGILLASSGYLSGNILPVFIILLLLQGVAQGFTTTPTSSLLGDLIPQENHSAAVGFFNFLGNVGMILGPIFLLLFGNNYSLAFFVAGLIEVASLGVSLVISKHLKIFAT